VSYSGTDDSAEQVHAAREEAAAACASIVGQLERVHDDLAQLHADHGDTSTVECANCAGASPTSGTDNDPTYVRLASSDALQPTVVDAYKGSTSLLLFGFGLVAGAVTLSAVLWRLV